MTVFVRRGMLHSTVASMIAISARYPPRENENKIPLTIAMMQPCVK